VPRRIPLLGIILGLLALAGVLGLSALVGFGGAPKKEEFDWDLASVFGTALGTTLLAIGTGALAWSTRADVRATQELAELTKKDQTERERPVVILLAANFQSTDDQSWLNVELVNVGLGPALGIYVFATYLDDENRTVFETEGVTWPTLAPNERANFSIPTGFSGVHEPREGGFPLSGTYFDRSRRNEYPVITDWSVPDSSS